MLFHLYDRKLCHASHAPLLHRYANACLMWDFRLQVYFRFFLFLFFFFFFGSEVVVKRPDIPTAIGS